MLFDAFRCFSMLFDAFRYLYVFLYVHHHLNTPLFLPRWQILRKRIVVPDVARHEFVQICGPRRPVVFVVVGGFVSQIIGPRRQFLPRNGKLHQQRHCQKRVGRTQTLGEKDHSIVRNHVGAARDHVSSNVKRRGTDHPFSCTDLDVLISMY